MPFVVGETTDGEQPEGQPLVERDAAGTVVAIGGGAVLVLDVKSAKQLFRVLPQRTLAGRRRPRRSRTALYDLENGKRIKSDSTGYVPFNDTRKLSGAFAFTHDSKTMLFLTGLTASLTLPGRKATISNTLICKPGDLAVRAAAALGAPLAAFAFLRGNKVALVQTKAKEK